MGFEVVETWSPWYSHPTWQLPLIVYVDDFKQSGPEKYMGVAWRNLQQHHEMDEPIAAPLDFGCKHRYSRFKTNDDFVRTALCDMKDYLIPTVDMYQKACVAAAGEDATLRQVVTPFIEEIQTRAIAHAPFAHGLCIECAWCGHTCLDDNKRT